jgi:hypothetical protein
MWFTGSMPEASELAQQACDDAAEAWSASGLTTEFGDLVRDVWGTNASRHEPDEFGDNAQTLGFLCSANLCERAERRARGHDYEPVAWGVDGLTISKPNGSLRLELGSRRFHVMKAPVAAGRSPRWGSFASWEAESHTRHAIAEINTQALGGYHSSQEGQESLWPFITASQAGAIKDFLVVWAGDLLPVLTAAWITVPVLGDAPFAARKLLWWDDEGGSSFGMRSQAPVGPSFDTKPAPAPAVTLKPRPAAGQA